MNYKAAKNAKKTTLYEVSDFVLAMFLPNSVRNARVQCCLSLAETSPPAPLQQVGEGCLSAIVLTKCWQWVPVN